jgi:hypothetical protein
VNHAFRAAIVGLFVSSVFAGVAQAAPITYDLNISGGSETIQGFIKTDGVIGDINGHVLDWAFSGTGTFAFSISSATAARSWPWAPDRY